MSREPRRVATPLLLVLWWGWAIAMFCAEIPLTLRRRVRVTETRRSRWLGYLALPGQRLARLFARLANACPICFQAERCPYHWVRVHGQEAERRRSQVFLAGRRRETKRPTYGDRNPLPVVRR